jgi:AcrR family transcriptional regulator
MTLMADRRAAPTATVLRWVRPPQQARTRAGLDRLLNAAEALIADKGFDDASIAEIARRAGSSVGGFYRRFRDKDVLLHAVHERFCDEARATADEALDPARWTGAATPAVVYEVVAFLVRVFRERAGFLRALLVRGIADPAVRERTAALFDYVTTRLAALLQSRQAELAHPDPTMAATFGLRVLVGTLHHEFLIQPSNPAPSDAQLAAELTRVLLCYWRVADADNALTTPPRRRHP